MEQLIECCDGLESTKSTFREASAENLLKLLYTKKVLKSLSLGERLTWDDVLRSVHTYLLVESEKVLKRKSANRNYNYRRLGDYLVNVVKVANKNGNLISITNLLTCISNCFESMTVRKQFSRSYIIVLRDGILAQKKYWSELTLQQWTNILSLLKELIKKPVESSDESKYYECLQLLIKYGPLHKFSSVHLRQEFDFIHQLCEKLNNVDKSLQIHILHVVMEFCKQTAYDCRMACCKLGEDIFRTISLLFYRNAFDSNTKLLIVDFLLLQVNIHHPNGHLEGSNCAFAVSFPRWRECLKALYQMLEKELDQACGRLKKNSAFICQKTNALHESFVLLTVAVFRQVFNSRDLAGVADVSLFNESTSQLSKRRKIEVNLLGVIEAVRDTKDWPWINVLTVYLKKYPESITCEQFQILLQILSEIQSECNSVETLCHLYKCLIVLVDVQKHLNVVYLNDSAVQALWSVVWDSTIRAAGLNQNVPETNKLIQKLIVKYKFQHSSEVFRAYFSGVLKITRYSLRTLQIACQLLKYPEHTQTQPTANPVSPQVTLLNLILSADNAHVFPYPVTAELLVMLTLKQCPECAEKEQQRETKHANDDLQCVYLITAFGSDSQAILNGAKQKTANGTKKSKKPYLIDGQVLTVLRDRLCALADEILAEVSQQTVFLNKLVSVVVLFSNVISSMVGYGLVGIVAVNDDCLYQKLEFLLQYLSDLFPKVCQLSGTGPEMRKLIDVLENLDGLFTCNVDVSFMWVLRNMVPVELTKSLFLIFHNEENVSDEDGHIEQHNTVKETVLSILINYCCVPGAQTLNQYQTFALKALLDSDFDATSDEFCDQKIKVLASLKKYAVGSLNGVLSLIAEVIQKICVEKYTQYDVALRILNILYDLYPHLAVIDDNDIKDEFVNLLYPFFDYCEHFGPEISVAVVNCIGRLAEVHVDATWCVTDAREKVARKILRFVESDFQEVRLAAVENLVTVFSTENFNMPRFHVQKLIFDELYETCLAAFRVETEGTEALSEERRADEIVTRTASVLHTYGAIVSVSNVWRSKALFSLIRIVDEKHLNAECLQQVMKMVAKYLNCRNVIDFLDKYLDVLIEKWFYWKGNWDTFPYSLLDCNSKQEFYVVALPYIVPLSVRVEDAQILASIAEIVGSNVQEVVEDSFSKIISNCLPMLVPESVTDETNRWRLISYDNMTTILGTEKVNEMIVHKLEDIVVDLVTSTYDEGEFQRRTSVPNPILFEPDTSYISCDAFMDVIKWLEKKSAGNGPLFRYLITEVPDKIQKIMLKLAVNIYSAPTLEQKIRSFFHYTLILDLVISNLQRTDKLAPYLVRDIVYTMVNLINQNWDSKSQHHLILASYFKHICTQILPTCSNLLEELLFVVVNVLVPIVLSEPEHNDCCLDLLNYFIVENNSQLTKAVKTLDPFPEHRQFERINEVYKRIKYGTESPSLENEITHFLDAGQLSSNTGFRLEALGHLKTQLSHNKRELKVLYSKLHETRGFSENTRDSVLHRLICMLVGLATTSRDVDVKLGAAACLGELGPADLTTLVLRRKASVVGPTMSDVEFATGCVISRCLQYIVSADVEVVQAASAALYKVMESKEGWSVADNWKNSGFGTIEKAYLLPFMFVKKARNNSKVVLNTQTLTQTVDDPNLWCPKELCEHSQWIINLVCALLRSILSERCYLQHLIPVCKVKLEFSEALLPLLVNLLLRTNDPSCARILSSQVSNFFNRHWELTTVQGRTDECHVIPLNRLSVQCMLDVVNFLRREKNELLKLNYLHVAQAAKFCSAYFSVLLYSELWAYETLKIIKHENPQRENFSELDVTVLDVICQYLAPSDRRNLQNILKEAFTAIGDLDALRGCGSSYLLEKDALVDYYKQLGRWQEVILHHDVQISRGISNAPQDMMASLKRCSLYKLPLMCASDESEFDYECMWRLGQWSVGRSNEPLDDGGDGLQKLKYFMVKAVHDNDWYGFEELLKVTHCSVIKQLNDGSLESCKNLYGPLSELQCLVELKDFAEAKKRNDFDGLLEKWRLQDEINRNEFQYVEPIQAQRIVLLRDLMVTSNKIELKECLTDFYLNLSELARKESQFSVATRALEDLCHIDDVSENTRVRLRLEEAQICWANNDRHTGRHILRQLLTFEKSSESFKASILKLYGGWMIETRSQSAHTIIKDYLLESLKIDSRDGKAVEILCETHVTIARIADKEYQQVMAYIKSSEFERKVQTMKKSKEKAAMLKRSAKGNVEELKAYTTHERQSQIDKHKIESTYKEKDTYLLLASKHYVQTLLKGDKNDTCIFRLFSLWLENKSNAAITELLKRNLPNVPTYKFISILPQLVPHISDDELGEQILEILERCVRDHPHHTLPVILALVNSEKDREYNSSRTQTETNESRVVAAQQLLRKVGRGEWKTLIEKMRKVADALIELAYAKCPERNTHREEQAPLPIPSALKIRRLEDLSDVLVPTCTLPVRKDANYADVVGIHSFGNKFMNVGGINAPKRISCRGTDGVVRLQLVKGQDDLRQDSVMQQVFTIMNGLFASNKQTSKLLVRTYKVVPLSMRSGILEWVENTNPIGSYLEKAHDKYNLRGSYKATSCRNKLKVVAKKSLDEKLKTYKDICLHFEPVFHKFFETSFLEPAVWYERRRLYMYSVATSSMCGYILGIGDRHVQNILIDDTTAEVIHIDFGIAFDQGQVLPTPETVPFRLTRDIEDGMGVCGIEGVFRRACERTMEVLRQNYETIIAILEVLLYDPLYTWTVSPAEAYNRQQDVQDDASADVIRFSDEERLSMNVSAERALLRLREKLQGREDGSSTSIEGQVEKLLQQARDPANLCQLFNGWQAYL